MNFKTTAILFIVLLAVGGVALILNQKSDTPVDTKKELKLIDISPNDVTKLAVTPADGQAFVLGRSGSEWKLAEPVKAAAETWSVDALVRKLADLTSRGESSSSLGDAGLDKPAYKVEITAGGRTHKLNVGKKAAAGGTLFVQREGDKKPVVVADDLLAELEKPYTSYRQTKLVTAPSTDIKQLVIDRGEAGRLTLVKTGDNWQITTPQQIPADSSEVSNLTFALTGLTAAEYVKDADVPAALHPAKNAKTTIWFSTGAPSTQPAVPTTQGSGVTVSIGDFDSLLKKNVYVAVSNPAAVAKVAASSVDAFNKTALDLRDRKVVEIDPKLVSKLSIVTNTPATTQPTTKPASRSDVSIERRKEELALGPSLPTTQPTTQPAGPSTQPVATWLFKAPKTGEASDGKVDALLEKFRPLKADKYMKDGKVESPAAVYAVAITSEAAGKTTEHRLTFTDPGSDKPLVGECNGLFFEVPRTLIEALTGEFGNK